MVRTTTYHTGHVHATEEQLLRRPGRRASNRTPGRMNVNQTVRNGKLKTSPKARHHRQYKIVLEVLFTYVLKHLQEKKNGRLLGKSPHMQNNKMKCQTNSGRGYYAAAVEAGRGKKRKYSAAVVFCRYACRRQYIVRGVCVCA